MASNIEKLIFMIKIMLLKQSPKKVLLDNFNIYFLSN